MREMGRRRFLEFTLASACLIGTGCGTIMYPERRGQPGGALDWKVVALDAVGLLLFLVPGVIAFAVDFSNGTIYLPPGSTAEHHPTDDAERTFVTVQVPDEPITIGKLEEIVSQHAERAIELSPGTYQTEPLASIDDFWTASDEYLNPSQPG